MERWNVREVHSMVGARAEGQFKHAWADGRLASNLLKSIGNALFYMIVLNWTVFIITQKQRHDVHK